MNDTKHISTPKTCPLLGSHFMSVQTTVKGIHVASTQGPIPNTVGCLETACRFWNPIANECFEVLKAQAIIELQLQLQQYIENTNKLLTLFDKRGRE